MPSKPFLRRVAGVLVALALVGLASQSALAATRTTFASRGAFVATLCLAHPDGRDQVYEGRVEGTLVWPPRGDMGFGFDPVFMPEGFDVTFGEMPAAAKHSYAPGRTGLSHRARALASFVEAAIEHD